ncbi:hypothetical protein [Minwuia sp.]|uniref:hypothetical protein n=1 Tax=Minwuia sp. TaxID=2493630 RepID=UPI003A9372BD
MRRGLDMAGAAGRGLAAFLGYWPWLLVALFFASPEGPHLWIATSKIRTGAFSHGVTCTYLGSRGFVRAYVPDCPGVIWLDSREWR